MPKLGLPFDGEDIAHMPNCEHGAHVSWLFTLPCVLQRSIGQLESASPTTSIVHVFMNKSGFIYAVCAIVIPSPSDSVIFPATAKYPGGVETSGYGT
uniref:Uncharacterized protein n=2 Tax=Physcomitrium patens TaxID=3218 RepID=A0A7I3YZ88_PHYPA